MAWIFKPKKKEVKRKYTGYRKNNNIIHKYVYNTLLWRQLRLAYLKENPFCEICKEKGKLKLAEQVHHIYEISNGKDITEIKDIGYDWHNLQSVCKECHKEVHKK